MRQSIEREIIEREAQDEAAAAWAHGARAPWGDGVIPAEAVERLLGRRLTAEEWAYYGSTFVQYLRAAV